MTTVTESHLSGIRRAIAGEIHKALRSLEDARQTLARTDTLADQYRRLLRCEPAERTPTDSRQ